MTKPIFSIITVTYNAGHSLEKTIQNILSQTYKEIERSLLLTVIRQTIHRILFIIIKIKTSFV